MTCYHHDPDFWEKWVTSNFPNVTQSHYSITSCQDKSYNCIGYACGHNDVWIWPEISPISRWPQHIPMVNTIDAFTQLFAIYGYEEAENGDHEAEIEKLGLFTLNGEPTHAARQIADGVWKSKLGQGVDIEHSINGLDGGVYGDVAVFFKRPCSQD